MISLRPRMLAFTKRGRAHVGISYMVLFLEPLRGSIYLLIQPPIYCEIACFKTLHCSTRWMTALFHNLNRGLINTDGLKLGGQSHWSSTWPYSLGTTPRKFSNKTGVDIHPRLTLCSYERGRCIYIYIINIYIDRQNLSISFKNSLHDMHPALLNLSLSEGRHFHSPHSGYFLVPVARCGWNKNGISTPTKNSLEIGISTCPQTYFESFR